MSSRGITRIGKLVGLAALMTFAVCRPLPAHERSESFSRWRYAHGVLSGIITVRSREVTRLALPGEGDGYLADLFAAHAEKTISAATDGNACTAIRPPNSLDAQPGYIRLGVEMRCSPGDLLELHMGTFFDVAPSHHHFIYVEAESGAGREAILTVSEPTLQVDLKPSEAQGARVLQFIEMGIGHIATGIDHLAFLLALLVTARTGRQVLLAVTGFTIGHSLTLTLAVTGLLQANRGAVEALIGLTIAVAAARNLIGEREGRGAALAAAGISCVLLLIPATARPDMPASLIVAIGLAAASFLWLGGADPKDGPAGARFLMAMCFGLIHGLGFASALLDLHLPQHMLVSTLVGFNIGVEIGQLAAVGMAAALLRAASRYWPAAGDRDAFAVVSSAALVAMGIAWFLVRAISVAG
ncbi:MAG TPA: HupE/UreJ family protein [Steroidobacteraceae bacterium]|nr:HupE/UreJ family protein [Steroidobacteraceae bacterium]